MQKVLFAVDGSEASLRAARGLAGILRWWKATDVELLNVQVEPFLFSERFPSALQERAERRVREEGERALATSSSLLQEVAARCDATVQFGDAATTIADAAQLHDCAMIAVGSHGAGAVGNLLMGSVTIKLIHIGHRPVLVIPSAPTAGRSAHGPPKRAVRILVPVDGSAGAVGAVREIVRIAPWFLEAPEIHLLAVYDRTPLAVEIAAMVDEAALPEHERRQFEAALAPVREILAGAGLAVTEHTAIGPPVDRIRAVVAAEGCDLACLGTRGMGTVRNLVLGSTTAKALRALEIPVLVVPPAER